MQGIGNKTFKMIRSVVIMLYLHPNYEFYLIISSMHLHYNKTYLDFGGMKDSVLELSINDSYKYLASY